MVARRCRQTASYRGVELGNEEARVALLRGRRGGDVNGCIIIMRDQDGRVHAVWWWRKKKEYCSCWVTLGLRTPMAKYLDPSTS